MAKHLPGRKAGSISSRWNERRDKRVKDPKSIAWCYASAFAKGNKELVTSPANRLQALVNACFMCTSAGAQQPKTALQLKEAWNAAAEVKAETAIMPTTTTSTGAKRALVDITNAAPTSQAYQQSSKKARTTTPVTMPCPLASLPHAAKVLPARPAPPARHTVSLPQQQQQQQLAPYMPAPSPPADADVSFAQLLMAGVMPPHQRLSHPWSSALHSQAPPLQMPYYHQAMHSQQQQQRACHGAVPRPNLQQEQQPMAQRPHPLEQQFVGIHATYLPRRQQAASASVPLAGTTDRQSLEQQTTSVAAAPTALTTVPPVQQKRKRADTVSAAAPTVAAAAPAAPSATAAPSLVAHSPWSKALKSTLGLADAVASPFPAAAGLEMDSACSPAVATTAATAATPVQHKRKRADLTSAAEPSAAHAAPSVVALSPWSKALKSTLGLADAADPLAAAANVGMDGVCSPIAMLATASGSTPTPAPAPAATPSATAWLPFAAAGDAVPSTVRKLFASWEANSSDEHGISSARNLLESPVASPWGSSGFFLY